MPLEQRFTAGVLWGAIFVDDEMQLEIGLPAFVDGPEEAQQLAMPVAGRSFAGDGSVEHV
jgi:hypothetical protein